MMSDVRCPNCNKLLGQINGEGRIKCPRCGDMVQFNTNPPNESVQNAGS